MQESFSQKEPPLYSLDYFMDLARGDMDFIKKILQLFIDIVPGLIVEMKKAHELHDLEETGRVAHKLKSNLDNMQIASITQTIREIEVMGKSGTDSPQLSEMINQVQDVVNNVVSRIKKDHPDL